MWAKLDDRFWSSPKLARVSDRSHRLYTMSLSFAAEHLTDGALTEAQVQMLDDLGHGGQRDAAGHQHRRSNGVSTAAAAAAALVQAGLFERTLTGYQIHDFLRYNFSREEQLREQAEGRERAARSRERRRTFGEAAANAQAGSPDPSRPVPNYKDVARSANAAPRARPLGGSRAPAYLRGDMRSADELDRAAGIPVPGDPPAENDDTPPEPPDQTRSDTADNLPDEPW